VGNLGPWSFLAGAGLSAVPQPRLDQASVRTTHGKKLSVWSSLPFPLRDCGRFGILVFKRELLGHGNGATAG
jgi:hypothetical protein